MQRVCRAEIRECRESGVQKALSAESLDGREPGLQRAGSAESLKYKGREHECEGR